MDSFDFRSERVPSRPKVKMRADGTPVIRRPEKIDGIVLHQTACEFAAPRLDRSKVGLAKRAMNVACHAMAFRGLPYEHDPFWVKATDLLWHVNHGNGFNPRSLGLEVDGRYAGDLERAVATTYGGLPTSDVDGVVEAAKQALTWLVEEGRRLGCPIRYIWAHRQSSADRRSDPGELLWKRVALEHGVQTLGLEVQPELALPASNPQNGPGRPLPAIWQPEASARY